MKFEVEERKCIVCGSTEKQEFFTKDPWSRAVILKDDNEDVVHGTDVICTKCGLIYKFPMMTNKSMNEFYSSGEYLAAYKPHMKEQISKAAIVESVVMTSYILDFFREIGYNFDGIKALDIGAGSGGLMKGMSSLGADVYGIEPCERHISIIQKVYGLPVWQGCFEDFYTNEKFDLVTICNTIEHFYDPIKALKQVKSMLNPGGQILIEVPSSEYPYPATLTGAFYSSAHNFTWNGNNMQYMLSQLDLNIENLGYCGHKKCMILLVKPQEMMVANSIKQPDIEELKERALQNQNIAVYAQQISSELSRGSDVNSIERSISSYQHITNALRYVISNQCLEMGRITDGLRLSQQPYQKAQSADFIYCQGSLDFTTAIGYRLLGDFCTAKKYLNQALESYPGIEKYNFVKEMYVDGIISESGFAEFPWYACKKLAKTLS